LLMGISAIPQDFLFESEPDVSIEEEDMSEASIEERFEFWNGSRITPDENGYYIMDDMYLNVFQYAQFTDDPAVHELARQAIKPRTNRWPAGFGVRGEIPYTFAEPIRSSDKEEIEAAIEDFNNQMTGCLRIRPKKSSDKYYAQILTQEKKRCSSGVALPTNGDDKIYVRLHKSSCIKQDTIQHEFIHAFGVYHMHSRSDRDEWIEIMMDNIQEDLRYNMDKHTDTTENYDVPYDPYSMMHYSSTDLAIDKSKLTIKSKKGHVPTGWLGGSQVMTWSDHLLLRRMYGCDEDKIPKIEADCKDTNAFLFTLPDGTMNMNSCKGWAELGKCKDPEVGRKMLEKCPVTCGFCPKDMSRCIKEGWKGDGSCDDHNNNPGCNWDGGDCCGDDVVETYCTDCKCFSKTSNCKDARSSCPRWATKYNYCKKGPYIDFMKANCKKSCGVC